MANEIQQPNPMIWSGNPVLVAGILDWYTVVQDDDKSERRGPGVVDFGDLILGPQRPRPFYGDGCPVP